MVYDIDIDIVLRAVLLQVAGILVNLLALPRHPLDTHIGAPTDGWCPAAWRALRLALPGSQGGCARSKPRVAKVIEGEFGMKYHPAHMNRMKFRLLCRDQ